MLAFERYLAVVRPIRHRNRFIGSSHGKRLVKYVSPVIILSIVFCAPEFFALNFDESYDIVNEVTRDSSSISSTGSAMFNMSDGLSPNQTKIPPLVNTTETFELNAVTKNLSLICLIPSEIMYSREYVLWYKNVANLIITGTIPFLLLAFFNLKIYMTTKSALQAREYLTVQVDTGCTNKNVGTPTTHAAITNSCGNNGSNKSGNSNDGQRHSKYIDGQGKEPKNEDHSQATVLLGIVIAFFICHILRIVLNVEEIVTFEELSKVRKEAEKLGEICSGVQLWTMLTNDVSHLLLQVNSSITFFIYIYFSTQFKEASKSTLIKIATCFHLYNIESQTEANGGGSFNTKNVSGTYLKDSLSTPTINRKRSKNQSKMSSFSQYRGEEFSRSENSKKSHVVVLERGGEQIQHISIQLCPIENEIDVSSH